MAYRAFSSLTGHGQISRADHRRAIESLRRDQSRLGARGVDGLLAAAAKKERLGVKMPSP